MQGIVGGQGVLTATLQGGRGATRSTCSRGASRPRPRATSTCRGPVGCPTPAPATVLARPVLVDVRDAAGRPVVLDVGLRGEPATVRWPLAADHDASSSARGAARAPARAGGLSTDAPSGQAADAADAVRGWPVVRPLLPSVRATAADWSTPSAGRPQADGFLAADGWPSDGPWPVGGPVPGESDRPSGRERTVAGWAGAVAVERALVGDRRPGRRGHLQVAFDDGDAVLLAGDADGLEVRGDV